MNLKELDIKGFILNERCGSPLDSIYYDKDDNEDNWVEIVSDSYTPERIIVKIVKNCQEIKITAFDSFDIDYLEEWLNTKTQELFKDE